MAFATYVRPIVSVESTGAVTTGARRPARGHQFFSGTVSNPPCGVAFWGGAAAGAVRGPATERAPQV